MKFVATALADGRSSVWMFRAPMLKRPARPVSRTPPTTGTLLAGAQPDLAAEEQQRHVARRVAGLHAGEVEDALAFDEEVALLGEEQAEARQVDLLEILFDLREVGAVGGVDDEAAGQAVPEVDAGVAPGRIA